MKMINLSIILEDIRLGGPQKQLIYFLNKIDTKKFNIILIIPKKNNLLFKRNISNLKVKIIETDISIPSKNNFFSYSFLFFKQCRNLKEIIKKNNTNLLYVACGSISIKAIVVSKILKIKTIWHIHDCKSNFFIKKFFQITAHKNIRTVFASEKSREYYLKKSDKHSYVLRSSVNTIQLNKKLRKIKNKLKVGLVANINPDKNIDLFFEIVKKKQ